ncbi:TIGR01457 family HAD-type hydrolase [Metasolibacillus meyeri]|uniref:TIGR01457 family HAD-type hydrolase n=1 Tax=Metasolibacillus meyeri TaxID=1071052 RepID=A0AAW9NJQ1_9BACL|nr:TIGR01457 family HAD-type hydrolase [Metasolibacillus meyeri]MEC1178909.1 TIGR01457 family HAD-type hydrolase [Metasolibacillus meyeri]
MRHYKAYCFDLDGTVYRGDQGIESAVAFIQKLQREGIEPFYVTNNAAKTPQQIQQKLATLGIEAPLHHIYSSALVTATYIEQHFPQVKVQVIGSDGIRVALKEKGIHITNDVDVSVVIMGLDHQVDYTKLATACIAIQNGAKLIGTNGDIKFPTEQGFVPANGSFVQLVASVADVEPIFIGKPSPIMLEAIATEHHYCKNDMVMIGDNYQTDILCGIRFGCDTVHVNTGVTSTAQVRLQEKQPTYCMNSLSDWE